MEMSECNLPRDDRVVMRYVGLGVAPAMLQFNSKANAKLLDVDLRPVHTELVSNPSSLVEAERSSCQCPTPFGHLLAKHVPHIRIGCAPGEL